MEKKQEPGQENREFRRVLLHRPYSTMNPTIISNGGDKKSEEKERMKMQRRHSYDMKYYKRELDRQAYPLSPPTIAFTTADDNDSASSSPSSRSPTLPTSPSSSRLTPYHENNLQDFNIIPGFSSPVLGPSSTYNSSNDDNKNKFRLDDHIPHNDQEESNNNNNNNNNNGGKDVTEFFLFRREWEVEIPKRE